MNEHVKNPLTEEELEDVAGGDDEPLYAKCWFTPAAGWRKDPDGSVWKQCNSTCGTGFTAGCRCWKHPHCVDKWHRVEGHDDSLYPLGFTNHNKKKPTTYEDNT